MLFAGGLWLAMTVDSQRVVVVARLPPSFHYMSLLSSLMMMMMMPRLQRQTAFVVALSAFVASTFGEVPKADQRLIDECH